MTLNEYQEKAMQTCLPTCNNFSYMMLNLVGEVGELSSKVAKAIRKEQMCVGHGNNTNQLRIVSDKTKDDELLQMDKDMMMEAGDILWQLSGLCKVMGWKFEDVGRQNLAKLESRKKRGVIDGNGDNR